MNPPTFTGPQFLVFYAVLVLVVLALVSLRRRLFEGGTGPREPLRDPLDIAYLRASPACAIGLTVLTLLERGMIQDDGVTLRLGSRTSLQDDLNVVEKVLLERCDAAHALADLTSDRRITDFFRDRELALAARGFVPTREHYVARFTTAAIAFVLLGAVVFTFIGSIRDTTPVTVTAFWIWIFASAMLLWGSLRFRTPAGERAIRELQGSFPRVLPVGTRPGSADAARNLLMLGAVHGYSALPEATRLRHLRVLPRGVLPARLTDIPPWVP